MAGTTPAYLIWSHGLPAKLAAGVPFPTKNAPQSIRFRSTAPSILTSAPTREATGCPIGLWRRSVPKAKMSPVVGLLGHQWMRTRSTANWAPPELPLGRRSPTCKRKKGPCHRRSRLETSVRRPDLAAPRSPVCHSRGRRQLHSQAAGVRAHGPRMAGGHESAGPGCDAGRADNVCADRYASGDKSPRRARVQSRPQRPSLGTAEAGAGSIVIDSDGADRLV